MTTEPIVKPAWRRPMSLRLSVRAMIVLVLLIGCGLGWTVQRARVQREAVAVITRGGGHVDYEGRYSDGSYRVGAESPWPKWSVDLVGIDYLSTATHVQDGMGDSPSFGDEEMAAIGRLGRLESLSLFKAGNVTDDGMAHLRGNPRLKQLLLYGTPRISGTGLVHLAGLRELERLTLSVNPLADADLVHLSSLVELRFLTLVSRTGSLVTNAGLDHLGKLTGIKHLGLHLPGVTDLRGLAHLTDVEHLNLAKMQVTDSGLSPLSGFVSLKTLNLAENAALTDSGLAHLRGLPNLTSLDLRKCEITDAGLAHLADCPKLEKLCLLESKVSDKGLITLVQSKRLSLIDVSLTRVTARGVEAARAARPDLEIRDH